MSLIVLSAATALASANLDRLIKVTDYPAWDLKEEKSAGALIDLIVRPDGRVLSCVLVHSIGDTTLAGEVCSIVAKKRVSAATTSDGTRSYHKSREFMRLTVPGTPIGDKIGPMAKVADVIVMVPKDHAGLRYPASTVDVAVDESGKITDCVAKPLKPAVIEYDGACNFARRAALTPLKLADGSTVPYVSVLKIEMRPTP